MKFNQRILCLSKRASLSKEERIRKSEIINKKVVELIKDKKLIMSYNSHGNEVDTDYINSYFKDLAFPVSYENGKMEAYVSKSFIIGKFGIKEPYKGNKINPNDLEVIMVPLVGFDEKKNRLGHGWGYYDRFLKESKALKIGLAFEIQKIDEILIDDYDISLDMIVTEKKIYY